MSGLPVLGRPAFLALVLFLFFVAHLYRITDPPNGTQRARETDTIAVARNFATESWNLLRPRVDARGTTDGVAGMELPLYSWSVAAASRVGGDIHGWARLLTVLGGVAALFGLHRVVRELTGQNDLAGLATFVVASIPLVAFYGRKIEPDVWALALATNALAVFVKWTKRDTGGLGVVAAVLTAAAGAIQPMSLAVGLPMIVAAWKRDGSGVLRRRRYRRFVVGSLLPVGIWFLYARHLSPDPAARSLSAWLEELPPALRDGGFWGNVFRTRLLELVIGVPALWAFGVGLARLPRLPNAGFVVAWIVGAFAACLAAAPRLTDSQDYCLLPAVFPCAIVTALGLRAALASSRSWVPVFTVAVLLALPGYGFVQVSDRYGEPYDFWAGRIRASLHLRAESLVVTMDPTPSFVLYYAGRKGWRIEPGEDASALERAAREGARYFLVERTEPRDLTPYRDLLGEKLYSDDWIAAYELRRRGRERAS